MSKIKALVFIILALFLVALLLVQAFFKSVNSGSSFESLIFWNISFLWLYLVAIYKISSRVNLKLALILFALGGGLIVFNPNMAETVMRLGLMGLLIGLGQALVDLKRNV